MSTTTEASTRLRGALSNTLKGSAGNLVEWYDVYVYSVFASYFETQFFAPDDPNSRISIWAIFAVTFVMRPIGAWCFGRFADRHGRRLSLTVSVALMGMCSLIISVTPTAETIGMGAVFILVCARLVQGFATGGEYGASATYLSEAAVPQHRGLLSSFHYVTLIAGHVLAQLTLLSMVVFLSTDEIAQWGWRVAFMLGGVGAGAVWILRRTMDETLQHGENTPGTRHAPHGAGSFRELLSGHGGAVLLCIALTAGGTVAFYTYSVNGPMIMKHTFAGGDLIAGISGTLMALTVLMLLQPVGGYLSDRVGRKSLLVFFGVGGVLYSWVMILELPEQHDPVVAMTMMLVGFVVLTGYTSINAVVKAELFPAHVRALGVGFGYAIANSLFGGTAPMLYQGAVMTDQVPLFTGYVTGVIGISLVVCIICVGRRSRNWLDTASPLHPKEHDRQVDAWKSDQ